MLELPLIGITMGDPAGIGPEICLRALAEPSIRQICIPVVFGSGAIARRVSVAANIPFAGPIIPLLRGEQLSRPTEPVLIDCDGTPLEEVRPGKIDAACGRSAFQFIEHAIDSALRVEISAVVTAPVHKEALHLAKIPYPGHTEIFAALTKAPRACMLLTSSHLNVSMVTTHIGLAEVPSRLSIQRILDVIQLTSEAMRRLNGREPRIGVCGLNPHAGEHGLFGNEEERFIAPAIIHAQANGLIVEGPLPPDAAFVPHQRSRYDALVCQYHDQGHIPFKMLAFDTGVNVTLGLPIIRTSVDHGTAFDIAWKGVANPTSLLEAIRVAVLLAGERS